MHTTHTAKLFMKKTGLLLLLFVAFLVGCEKEVNITVPKIITLSMDPSTLDTVSQVVVAEARIDNEQVNLEYTWAIKDADNNTVAPLRTNKDSVWWVPKKEGNYRVEVTAGSGNKTVKTLEIVQIRNGVRFYRKNIVGKWKGVVTTPWIAPYPVDFEFFADGRYSAKCTNGTSSALYYGTDEDAPVKTYSINTVNEEGAAGEIIVLYGIVYTTTKDDLKKIRFSSDNANLSFEFYRASTYGPVAFNLKRQ